MSMEIAAGEISCCPSWPERPFRRWCRTCCCDCWLKSKMIPADQTSWAVVLSTCVNQGTDPWANASSSTLFVSPLKNKMPISKLSMVQLSRSSPISYESTEREPNIIPMILTRWRNIETTSWESLFQLFYDDFWVIKKWVGQKSVTGITVVPFSAQLRGCKSWWNHAEPTSTTAS